jgi:hypothetical protein
MRLSSGHTENHSRHIEKEHRTWPESQAQQHLNNAMKNSEKQMTSTALHGS